MDQSLLHDDEDQPPVYIMSKINDIGTCIKKLNENIIVKEIESLTVPGSMYDYPPSELQKVKILICDTDILCRTFSNMPQLKWAHCTWAGVEPLFAAVKTKPSFIVTRHAHEDLSIQMAEYVLTQVLMCEKPFCMIRDSQKKKKWWEMKSLSDVSSKRLNELTLGILGVGNMGQAIAKCFKLHGANIIGLSKTPRETDFGFFNRITVSLKDVLSAADYVVNTLPSTPETIGLLDGDVLQDCKKNAVFINVGRGNIVLESTLLRALTNKWLRRIILDVFEEEPPSENCRLWDCDQVTITPHCAAMSLGKNIAEDFVDSYYNYLQKKPMRSVVDWDKGY